MSIEVYQNCCSLKASASCLRQISDTREIRPGAIFDVGQEVLVRHTSGPGVRKAWKHPRDPQI